MVPFGRARAAALLVGLSPLACDLSTDADDGGRVAITEFRIERSEPPGTIDAGAWAVARGATLTFAWSVEGPVEHLVLSAGDRVVAELPPDATSLVDDCAAGPCGTAEAGAVVYTLAAVGSGDDPSADARSLAVQVSETAAPAQNKR